MNSKKLSNTANLVTLVTGIALISWFTGLVCVCTSQVSMWASKYAGVQLDGAWRNGWECGGKEVNERQVSECMDG